MPAETMIDLANLARSFAIGLEKASRAAAAPVAPEPVPFKAGDRVKLKGADRRYAPGSFGVVIPGCCSLDCGIRVRFDAGVGSGPAGMAYPISELELDLDHPSLAKPEPALPEWFAVGRKVVLNRQPDFPEIWPAEIVAIADTEAYLQHPGGDIGDIGWCHWQLAPYEAPAEPTPNPAARIAELEKQVTELQAERDALQDRIDRALEYCGARYRPSNGDYQQGMDTACNTIAYILRPEVVK